ncbi:MAG: WD40/YVTN/BNR-like repeat-containing protein [Roseiflexaceae bacterium]
MAKAELIYLATDSGLVTLSNPGGIGRWLKAGTSMQAQPLRCVWSNPQDPTHVICGDGHQLWQSHDGAQQWQPMAGPACCVLYASRTSPSRILAGDGATAWLSHDAGGTWHALGNAQHVGMAGETLWYDQMLSTDGGMHWQAIPATMVALSYDAKSRLICAADGAWMADATSIVAPPVHCLSWAVCGGTPWTAVGADGSTLWRYHEEWTPLPQMPVHLVHASLYHPDQLWAGGQSGAVWLSTDRGQTWLTVRSGLSPITAITSARLV